jgi:DNA repair exonuclease SbcCD ATPase subunit
VAELLEARYENFGPFAEACLPLYRRGLVRVFGRNRDTEAAKDNGSGKTTLFRGLHWGLFEETVERLRGKDDIIRKGQKSCLVEIDIEGGYTIRRWRTRAARGVALLKDGERLKMPEEQIEKAIQALIGMDATLWRNTIYYAQGERRRFIYPEVTDKDRKSIIHAARRADRFDAGYEVAKRRFAKAQKVVDVLEEKLARATARLSEHDLESLIEQSKLWQMGKEDREEEALAEVQRLRLRHEDLSSKTPDVVALKAQLARLEAARSEFAAAERRMESVRKKIKAAKEEERELESSLVREGSLLEQVEQHLRELGGSNCPLCSSKLSKGDALAHLEGLKAAKKTHGLNISSFKAMLRSSRDELEELDGRATAIQNKLNARSALEIAINGSKADIKWAKRHDDMVAESSRALKQGEANLKRVRDESDPHRSLIDETKHRVKTINKLILAIEKRLKQARDDLAHERFWVAGCSPSGMSSYALDDAMAPLTHYTNEYLQIITDGDISMNFSTQRELRGGGKRDQIGIDWTIEGIENGQPSSAQWKKMEIGAQFGLMDLSFDVIEKPPGLLILDEFLDNLDEVGVERMLEVIHSLRSKRHTIFVISHVAPDVFEQTLKVVKKDQVSRIVEVKR